MHRRNLLLVMSILLALSFALIGCGSDETNSSLNETGEPKENNSTKNENDSKEKITLEVVSTTILEDPEADVEQEIADAFMEEHPNVEIEFIGVPMNELHTRLLTMATGNNLPDVFPNNVEYMKQFDEMGIVEDLGPILGDDFIEGFYESNIEDAMIDDKLMFSPWFSAPMGILYRADWLEEVGETAPETWDEFLEVAKAMTIDGDRWGFALVGSRDGSGTNRFIHILRTFGAEELYRDNGEWVTDIGSEESIEAFDFFTSLVTEHDVVPPGPTQVSYGEAVTLIATEKAGMMVTGPHTTGAIYSQNPDLEGKLGSIPLPKSTNDKGQHISTLGVMGHSISTSSEHKDIAAEYIKFFAEKKNQIRFNEVTGRMPTRIDAGEEVSQSDSTFAGFVEALDYAISLPQADFYADVQDSLGEAYQNIITDQSSVEDAVNKAREQIESAIANE